MEIADISGKIVFTQTEIPGNIVVPVSLHVSKGYYILRIFSAGKKIATIRIIKS